MKSKSNQSPSIIIYVVMLLINTFCMDSFCFENDVPFKYPTDSIALTLSSEHIKIRIQSDLADRRVDGWSWERMPHISTADKQFNNLYYRCILSVMETRWSRENFLVNPFYAIGSWGWTIAWDLSFASEMLAILDPEGLRKAILTFIRFGFLRGL